MIEDLDGLADRIRAAARLSPLDAARELRSLAPEARRVLAAGQDHAIAQATDTRTHEQVADALDLSLPEINRRVSAHHKRTGQPSRRGRRWPGT